MDNVIRLSQQPDKLVFRRSVFVSETNCCSGYRVKTANHPAIICWDATVGAAISRPKPYGFQRIPFCRKREMIEPFRAADSRPYGSNVWCFHGCCSKPIAYIVVFPVIANRCAHHLSARFAMTGNLEQSDKHQFPVWLLGGISGLRFPGSVLAPENRHGDIGRCPRPAC